jgi:hypothetical protein
MVETMRSASARIAVMDGAPVMFLPAYISDGEF